MKHSDSRSLIPMPSREVVVKSQKQDLVPAALNGTKHEFHTREDVRNLLPDILGKALARIWIDPAFHHEFATNPIAALAKNGVHLPENIVVEFQKQGQGLTRIAYF